MRSRGWAPFTVALTGALILVACGEDSSERSARRRAATTTTAPTTTPTTVAPQTVPVPPIPAAPPTTGPPPPITVPPAPQSPAPRTTTTPRTTTPRTTTEPTVTAAPGTSTSTTKPTAATRKAVVYSPDGAPRRRGDLLIPRKHEDTIVVLVHGGGESASRKQMRSWANFYAEHGYPSFAIDYLLAKATTPSPVYAKPETDVKAAVQYLRQRAGALALDPDRVVVQGFAAGAALGAQAEVTPNDAFFDGPSHYPNVNDEPAAFIGFYGRYDGRRPDQARYYGGPPDSTDPQVQARYAEANSIAHAAGAAGPTLLFQGDADNPDPVGQAGTFSDALQGAGKDVTLSAVPGAGPYFDQEEKSGALTPAGEQAAQQVLQWLAARFPPK